MIRILFQGDSITDAGRDRANPEHLGSGYPKFVAGAMSLDHPGEYEFINRGISGNRIVDVYARIKADIINLKPDVMSIMIGVNDVWHELSRQNGVDAEKFERIYDMLISEIKAELPDLKVIILSPYVMTGTSTEALGYEEFHKEVQLRIAAAKRIAEKYGFAYVDLQQKFDEAAKGDIPRLTADGVHPVAGGIELIKRAWLEAYQSL
ncbi:MAG: SGNH/GDSL hydrolase family protein [Clostridia bacterium]|nr:SGNH/GDSL hydrolase family protein [Clostridia bacterium]